MTKTNARGRGRTDRADPTGHLGHISVTGAPAAWAIVATARALVAALRAQRHLPREALIVLAVSVVGAKEMRALNRRFRGKDRPTDVLSFEQPRARPGVPTRAGMRLRGVILLGDVVLCAPLVRAQAKREGHGVRAEAAVLLAHGLFHLLGYDHEGSSRDARRMARAENAALAAAGVRQTSGLVDRAQVKGGP